jgi:ribokinase
MPSEPSQPSQPSQVDLLIVGALTIDLFEDGSVAAGGSVVHATRAAARRGASVAAVIAAGPEAEAASALRALRELGIVQVQEVAHTLVFRHSERNGVRRLGLEGRVTVRPDPGRLQRLHARALLLAPVAGELDAVALEMIDEGVDSRIRIAQLQGWLRRRAADGSIEPLAPADVSMAIRARLGNCDVLVASHEDLVLAEPVPTEAAVRPLRRALPGPSLVVTWGGAGYAWVGPEGSDSKAVRRKDSIVGVPTVGAGDAFAAVIALELDRGARLAAAARAADAAVELALVALPGATRVPNGS